MKKFISLMVVLGITIAGHGDVAAGVSDAAVLFLRIAAGARAAGMGEAFVAVADDATATHWNPAGLGRYPLSSEFHEFRVTDDRTIREKATRVLKGQVDDDYSEAVGQLLFRKNEIVHLSESGEKRFVEYDIDPDVAMVQYISENAIMDDREALKLGVRAIARENTGVTFQQINSQRERILGHIGKDKVDEINRLFETIVADWQNLKIVPESITFLEERLSFVLQDNQITADEYTDLVETLANTTRTLRPRTVRIPYPVLLSLWKDYALPWETRITTMVLLKNDIPGDNYTQFDIWALTPSGLIRWDGVGKWESSFQLFPRRDDRLQALVSAFTEESDTERLQVLKARVAAFNYGVTKNQVEDIAADIRMGFSERFTPSDMFKDDLGNLVTWFENMVLDPDRFSSFLGSYERAMSDDILTAEEMERLEFELHGSHVGRLPATVRLPYSLALLSDPTCIAATDKLLWVGTHNGLYLFNGRVWRRFTTENGLPSDKINAFSVYDKNRLWVATGKGVAAYHRGQWTTYPPETGLEETEFTRIYGYSRDKAWAAAGNRLFFYNGTRWSPDFRYVAVVDDTLSRMVREFTGIYDPQYIQKAVEEIKARNGLSTDNPDPGTEILMDYGYAFRHQITSMLYDDESRNLWVGTTHGLKIFADGRFRVFGYKTYTAPEDMTPEDAARDFERQAVSSRVDQLAAVIRSYNYVEDKIPAGNTVYVYSNPLGSNIHSISSAGNDIFVGTDFGTMKYFGGRFARYYHNNLEREKTVCIEARGGDIWFATNRKVVVYAHAKREITLMHAKWLPELASDLYFEYLSYVQQLGDDWGTIGLNATFLSYGDIVRTTEFSSLPIDTFHSFDGALALTYGASVNRNVSLGVTAKVIYSRLSDQGAGAELGQGNATAFAVDAGILIRTPIDRLTFGAALTNLGPNIAYIDAAQSDPLPRNLAVGLAYDLVRNPYNRLTLVGEGNKMLTGLNDGFREEMREVIKNVGLEFWYGSFLAFRAGYINDDVGQINTPTVGLGVQIKQLRFDFAYIPSSETVPLANTLRISLTGRL